MTHENGQIKGVQYPFSVNEKVSIKVRTPLVSIILSQFSLYQSSSYFVFFNFAGEQENTRKVCW